MMHRAERITMFKFNDQFAMLWTLYLHEREKYFELNKPVYNNDHRDNYV